MSNSILHQQAPEHEKNLMPSFADRWSSAGSHAACPDRPGHSAEWHLAFSPSPTFYEQTIPVSIA